MTTVMLKPPYLRNKMRREEAATMMMTMTTDTLMMMRKLSDGFVEMRVAAETPAPETAAKVPTNSTKLAK